MSTQVEWLTAAETSVQVVTPGEEWAGGGRHRSPVIVLAKGNVIAIEGTPSELRALSARIAAVVAASASRFDAVELYERHAPTTQAASPAACS